MVRSVHRQRPLRPAPPTSTCSAISEPGRFPSMQALGLVLFCGCKFGKDAFSKGEATDSEAFCFTRALVPDKDLLLRSGVKDDLFRLIVDSFLLRELIFISFE